MDVQLSLPAHFMPVAQPIATIVKRDGRRMPFNTIKIANAISRAAKSIGEDDFDRAESFASAVALSLAAQLGFETPTVDHVHDAVERVLIEMGYHRIALAYVRYRDRRGRMRELCGEDPHSIKEALSDARRVRESVSGNGGVRHRFVRTSRDTLAHWGRERIVETLVRETGLDAAMAERIACEVETQVQHARLSSVSAPVIRELVGAKLIEYGLDQHHRRHARLGVPLFDVDSILADPHSEAPADIHDPATTDVLLARRVKREYALTRVFTPEVAEAHQRGDLHIHFIDQMDRIEHLTLSIEYLKRFGLFTVEGRPVSRPARRSDALIGQLGRFTESLQRCVSEGVQWQAVNLQMAPYIVELDRYVLADTAQELLLEFVYRDVGTGVEAPKVTLEFVWDVPSHLTGQEALGPGGIPSGRPYDDFLPTAREFAWALLDSYARLHKKVAAHSLPEVDIVMAPTAFSSAEFHAFVERAGEMIEDGVPLRFRCDRESPLLPLAVNGLSAREVLGQSVTLNLPRLAYTNYSDSEFFRELEDLFDTAARAHVERFTFLRGLFSRAGAGPLARLCLRRNGHALLHPEEAQFRIGIAGLEECARAFKGEGLESDVGGRFAGEVLGRMQALVDRWRLDSGLSIVLSATRRNQVLRRLAEIDLDHYGYPVQRALNARADGNLAYLPGVSLAAASGVDESARLRTELHFMRGLADAELDVTIPPAGGAALSFGKHLQAAIDDSTCARVRFVLTPCQAD